MNKRIQKKVAKRHAEQGETAQAQAAAAQPGAPRAVAEQAPQQPGLVVGAVGAMLAVAGEVQERTSEAIGQVKEKVAETKQMLVEQEERAEALLERVPVVGTAAAKKLHDLTHR
jgi:hypothetical protein